MITGDLFDNYGFVEKSKPTKTCRTCRHREPWECGASVIQYCGVRKSNRTYNGLLKIKAKNPACELYEEGNNYVELMKQDKEIDL